MNERIRQLAEQAGIVIPKDSEYNGHIYRNSIERFAELIVKECALLCVSRPGPGDDIRSREHCSEQIKEHFGVEA
jgi:hypothetical protein